MVEWRGGLPFLALGVGRILMRDKGSKMEHYEVFRKSVVNPPSSLGSQGWVRFHKALHISLSRRNLIPQVRKSH